MTEPLNFNGKELNSKEWYRGTIVIEIDRISLLTLVGSIELTMRYPDMPLTTREALRKIGMILTDKLLEDGVIVPDEIYKIWHETFTSG